ncbi:ABC transporter permease [Jiella avicenniae]|uniref:ABC transporter permease n=1 Tax=Jiella avicenniae TaxID=2907202 RepID=A0A9X1P3N2_9HYPH|nr:ABC transporter permease [Jiella avicenniae]MCE7029164.1 ABC transporter permease [Jiella avicenniae]
MTITEERDDGRDGQVPRRVHSPGDFRDFLAKSATQWRVVRALMIRDIMSRYGRENIGFLWLIGEPVLLIGGIIVLWSIMKGAVTHGVSMISFALTSYSMLTLWRHIVGRGTNALKLNTGLLFHQNVRVLDTILAQILTEFISTFLSFLFCYLLLYLFGFVDFVDDPLLMVIAWALMTLFAGGFALCLGALIEVSKPVERMIQPLMYFTLPLTGSFYMLDWMPQRVRDFLLLFPMVHAQEMFRAGFMGPRFSFYYDGWYLFAWGIIAFSLGLTFIKRAERNLHVA